MDLLLWMWWIDFFDVEEVELFFCGLFDVCVVVDLLLNVIFKVEGLMNEDLND